MAELPQYLLLLPPPPWPATAQAVQAAYQDPLSLVLKQLAFTPHQKVKGAKLDIALPVPYLFEHLSRPRASLYPATQALVAQVYKLICVIAAREKINVEDAEGIDARIILVARPRHDETPQGQAAAGEHGGLVGVVIDMPTLARSGRPWEKVFSVESEDGEQLLKQFLRHQDSRTKTQRVAGGIVQVDETAAGDEAEEQDVGHHKSVIVGGTWDHIHIGHKLLLTMFSFMLEAGGEEDEQRTLWIGVTGDELLVKKRYAEQLQDWTERTQTTLSFLRAIMDFRPPADATVEQEEVTEPGANGHVVTARLTPRLTIRLVEISDPYGPTITVEEITAIVVSGESRAGGRAVNERRVEKDWHELAVFEVDVLDAAEDTESGKESESFESKLSSTSIRKAISERQQVRAKA